MATVTQIIYAPMVISGLVTSEQKFKVFRLQIRRLDNKEIVVDVECGGKRMLNGAWIIVPYIFNEAIKDVSYEHRVAVINTVGSIGEWSEWIPRVAGDNEYGEALWNNSKEETDHSIIVHCEHTNPPIDLDRIEVYEKDSSSIIDNHIWEADAIYYKPQFTHIWAGERSEDNKYFFMRAYDKSGNMSALSEPVYGKIRVILPGDMDEDPPDSTAIPEEGGIVLEE